MKSVWIFHWERLVACNDWEEKAKDKETRIRANAVKTFICEMFMLLKEIPTVEPTFKPIAEVKFDKEQLQEIVDKAKAEVLASIERPHGDCENCKHQAKLPSQDPCRRCLHCYISQFEPKDGSEPEMVTNDKLCDDEETSD